MTKRFPRGLVAGFAIAAALIVPAQLSNAATDGNMGATSTGSLVITARVPNLVRITGLADLDLGTWDGANPMAGSDAVCVYSTTRAYTLTAMGSGAGNAFTLTDGTNTVAYSVNWQSEGGANNALTTGTTVPNLGANHNSVTCNGHASDNATVTVSVSVAALSAIPAGTYTGTLTLTVAPD